jgi:hypothetical protein
VELDKPVTAPLDLPAFREEWDATGPADIKTLEPVDASGTKPVYDLELQYPVINLRRRIRYQFVRSNAEGNARFDFWLFDEETVLA